MAAEPDNSADLPTTEGAGGVATPPSAATVSAESIRLSTRSRPVTLVACSVIVAIFVLGLGGRTSATLIHWTYRDAFQVFSGAHWALITSAFLHLELWHVALNLYWVWVLGRAVEGAIGSSRTLVFLLASAYVASTFQLILFGVAGHGASGMVYALFGFGWRARARYASLNEVLDRRTIWLFFAWLFACFVILFNIVGNGAHLGGFLMGCLVGEAAVPNRRPRLAKVGIATLCSLTLFFSFLCPWQSRWWGAFAYGLDVDRAYSFARVAYEESLRLDPDQPWVRSNLERLAGLKEKGAPDGGTRDN